MKQAIKFMALMLAAILLFTSCSAPEAQVPEKPSPNNVSDIVNVTFQNLEAKTTAVSSGTVNNVDIASVFFQYKAKNLSGLKQGETTVWTNLTGEGIPGLGQTIKLGRGLWTLSLRGFATEEARTTAGTKETEETTAIFAGTIDEFSAGNGSSVLTAHADVPLIFTNAAGTGTLKITVNFTEAYAAVENKKVQVNLVVGDTYNETKTLTFGENGAETSAVATFENVANGIATITVDYLDSDGTPFGDSGVANTLIMTDMTTETSATISMDVVKLIVKGNKPTGAPEDYFIPKVFNSIFDIYPDNIYDNAIVVGYKETTKALDASAITYPYVVYKPVEQDENGRYTASSLGLTPIYGLSVDATEAWWGKTAALGGYGTNTKYSLKTVRIVDEATSIAEDAFWLCSKLETVIIPDSVTEIGETAFNGCSKLASITIPDGVITIGKEAFSGCRSLTDIVIPDSVTSIGFSAFEYCSNLTNVTIGKGLKTIGFQLFYQCTGLENISIPNSVESIDYEAFYNCKNLKNIVIPESVTSIGTRAFATGATTQVNVTYTGTLDQWYALGYGFGSTTDITCKNEEKAVLKIDKDSYKKYNVYGLTPYGTTQSEIIIPDFVNSISGFSNCTNITAITIPNSVTSISGFSGCTGLTSITIPESVITIGSSTFSGCSNLSNITYEGTEEQWYSCGGYDFGKDLDVICKDGEKAVFRVSKWINGSSNIIYCWGLTPYGKSLGLTEISIPEGVTYLPEKAFSGYSFTSVIIPNSVTEFGRSVFSYCSNLTTVKMPDTLTGSLGSTFSGCRSLTSITIPDGVTSISTYTFEDCSNLSSITIPATVTSIDSSSYFDCDNLVEVKYGGTIDQFYSAGLSMPSKADVICQDGNAIFHLYKGKYSDTGETYISCSRLTPYGQTLSEITIPDVVTRFNSGSFSQYSNIAAVYVDDGNNYLKSQEGLLLNAEGTQLIWSPPGRPDTFVTIPDSVTKIGESAFSGSANLTSVTVPNTVTSIGERAFSGCSGLTDITIPNSVTSIGNSAFYGCTNLTSVTIPDTITSIGPSAFERCSRLTDITIPDAVTSIDQLAFYNCSGLTSVTIGSGVTSIGQLAFYNCSGLTSLIIPENVTSIDKTTFWSCSGLTDIYVNQAESNLFANVQVPSGCKIHWNSTGSKPV